MQYATDNLVVEVLIHPQLYTLQQCMRNMLASFTKHRHIIHGGYTFAGSGSWVLNVRIFSETGRILLNFRVGPIVVFYYSAEYLIP